LWVTETCGCEALVTWNTRHFVGKRVAGAHPG
jgi:hypothetical protein